MSEESEEDCLASTPVTPERKNSDLIFIFQKTGFKRVYDLDYGIDLSGPGAFLQTCSGAEALAIWRNKFENPVTTAASSSEKTSSSSTDTFASTKTRGNDATVVESSRNMNSSFDHEKGTTETPLIEPHNQNSASNKDDARKLRAKKFREQRVGTKFSIRFDVSPCLIQDREEVYLIVFNVASNNSQFWIYKSNAFAEAFNDLAFADEEQILSPYVKQALQGFKMIQLRETPNGANVGKTVTSKANGGKVYQTRALFTTLKVSRDHSNDSKSIIDSVVKSIFTMVKTDDFRDSFLTMLEENNMGTLAHKIADPKNDVWCQLKHMSLRVTYDRPLSFNMLDEDIDEVMETITGHNSSSKWSAAQRSVAYEPS